MAEATPAFNSDTSVGPNDAAYAARAEAAAQQAAMAHEPAGDFDIAIAADPATGSPKAAESPAPLAGKFKDAKELEKAYLELQKKLGGEKEAEPKQQETPADAAKMIGADALNDFVSEYRTAGNLSEESYAKLQQMGLGKDVVDAYIEGQKAVAERQTESVYATVGGKENFAEILQWAATGLPQDEQEAFNGIMASGDMKAAAFAVKNLAARYSQEMGKPTRIEGKTVATPSGFRSKAEMIAAMSDPRYGRDAAYRQEVARKMQASRFVEN